MTSLPSSYRGRAVHNLYRMRRHIWQHFDILLFATCILLLVFGVAMIRSTTVGNPELVVLPNVQIRWAIIGTIVMFVITAIDYRLYQNLSRYLYIGITLWLGSIFILGITSFGSQRWLDFFGLFQIQPSEAAKIGSLIWVANFFARWREQIGEFRTIIISLIYTGVPIFLVLAQPDLSTSIMLMVIWFGAAWAAGLRLKHIAAFIGLGLLAAPLLWAMMVPYQRLRVLQFINPSLDPGAQYNIDQALISLGSGGLFGQGYNSASQIQLRFLKVRHTDFIFAATGAEFGLIGGLILIILQGILIWRILRIAKIAADPFGAYICYGFAAMTFMQATVNIGMNMNLLPVTGLPLPFVSYGGSSLLTFFAAIGLVQSVALRHKIVDF